VACYYTGSAEGDAALARQAVEENSGGAITELANLLYQVCRSYEAGVLYLPPEVMAWWSTHRTTSERRSGIERRKNQIERRTPV
jgi:hypothetical protein